MAQVNNLARYNFFYFQTVIFNGRRERIKSVQAIIQLKKIKISCTLKSVSVYSKLNHYYFEHKLYANCKLIVNRNNKPAQKNYAGTARSSGCGEFNYSAEINAIIIKRFRSLASPTISAAISAPAAHAPLNTRHRITSPQLSAARAYRERSTDQHFGKQYSLHATTREVS